MAGGSARCLFTSVSREDDMGTYVSIAKIRGQIQSPQKLRSIWSEIQVDIQETGAEIEQGYAILGEYDFLFIFSAPDRNTAYKASLAFGTQGLDMQTMEILPIEDFAQLVSE